MVKKQIKNIVTNKIIRLDFIFKLEEAKKAHEELESRKLNGPCILIP